MDFLAVESTLMYALVNTSTRLRLKWGTYVSGKAFTMLSTKYRPQSFDDGRH